MCAQKLKEDAKKGGGKLPFGGKTFTLLFIRNQLLHRNELFRKEWDELERLKQSRSRLYKRKLDETCKRWRVDERGDCYTPQSKIDMPVEFREGEFAKIQITVDMRYSLRMVLDLIKTELEGRFMRIRRNMRFHMFPISLMDGNIHSDIQDYVRRLKVWDLRKERKSWSQTAKKLTDGNVDTARNWYKQISTLIEEGLPGFPPFPQG